MTRFLESTWWEDGTDSHKLSSDCHMCAMALVHKTGPHTQYRNKTSPVLYFLSLFALVSLR